MAPFAPVQRRLDIRFPQRGLKDVAQDDEWCEIVQGEHVTRIRFHDYAQVYSIPGLYNQLFGGPDSETQCVSPQVMAGLLREQLPLVLHDKTSLGQNHDGDSSSKPRLRVLDLGAGNGMMGEEIRCLVGGFGEGGGTLLVGRDSTRLVGFDILPEAKAAAERERPGVYDVYVAADITEYVTAPPDDPAEAAGFAQGFNVLTSVSSLAFGDGSVRVFKAAVSLVDEGGLLVFNLKEDFFEPVEPQDVIKSADGNGEVDRFSSLIRNAVENGVLSIVVKRRYCHRYSVTVLFITEGERFVAAMLRREFEVDVVESLCISNIPGLTDIKAKLDLGGFHAEVSDGIQRQNVVASYGIPVLAERRADIAVARAM